MDGDGRVFSYIEARGQGGGDDRGQLFFATSNGGREIPFAAPRVGISEAGRVAIMGTTGTGASGDAHSLGTWNDTFKSASLSVFTGDTNDAAPYAGWFENRVDSDNRDGIYVSAVRDVSTIIRAAKMTTAGVETKVLEVTAAGKISGSAISTGSFGRVEVNSISASLYQGQIGSRYVHSQTSDSSTWSINHNIGQKYPVVTVYDTSDQMILPQNGVAPAFVPIPPTDTTALPCMASLNVKVNVSESVATPF
jgi:hypothetical protein